MLDAYQNIQFDFALAAALVIFGWAVFRQQDLAGRKPYIFAGIFLLLLALSPLLVLTDTLVRPHAKSQYTARSMAGLVIRNHRHPDLALHVAARRPLCLA